MGHLKSTELPEPYTHAADSGRAPEAGGRRWLWVVALVVVVALGLWYFRSKDSTEAQSAAGSPGGPRGATPRRTAATG